MILDYYYFLCSSGYNVDTSINKMTKFENMKEDVGFVKEIKKNKQKQ